MSKQREPPRPRPESLLLERLEDRVLLSADPVAAVAAQGESLINEPYNFAVSFDNTGTDVGYAPFLDVVVPNGVEVSTIDGAAAVDRAVGYWDATDSRWEDQQNGSGNPVDENPSLPGYAPGTGLPANPNGTTGDVWYQVTLPFGSFTPDQPPIPV